MAEAKAKIKEWISTGRRKTSVARVRLRDGSGKITINDRELNDYFTEDRDRGLVVAALDLTEMRSKLDAHINVNGGGFAGQAGAICQGVARALKEMFNPGDTAAAAAAAAPGETPQPPGGMTKKLRDSGYLTRDGRMKERKHYGLKGARKAFQFSKR